MSFDLYKLTILLMFLFACNSEQDIGNKNNQQIYNFTLHEINVYLSVSNPMPRIGEKISLEVSSEFIDSLLIKILPDGCELTKSYQNILTNEIHFHKSGEYILGPFEIIVDRIKFKTQQIKINVIDSLPMVPGLWVRLVNLDNNAYLLIIEQIVELTEGDYNNFKYSLNDQTKRFDEDKRFVVFNTRFTKGLKSGRTYSSIKNNSGTNLTYSQRNYHLYYKEEKPLILSKFFFERLPKEYQLPLLELK
jgi:hypothetical protein